MAIAKNLATKYSGIVCETPGMGKHNKKYKSKITIRKIHTHEDNQLKTGVQNLVQK